MFFLSVVLESISRIMAQWSDTWSAIIFHLTGRISSSLEPVVSTIIFPVRVSLSRVMVDVSKRVRLGTEQRMGRSQQVVSWPLESRRDVKTKICVSGKGIFPKSRVLSEEKVLCAKVRGKLLIRSHVNRQSDHHHLIMKSERMKNHDAHITYALQLLSTILYMP